MNRHHSFPRTGAALIAENAGGVTGLDKEIAIAEQARANKMMVG